MDMQHDYLCFRCNNLSEIILIVILAIFSVAPVHAEYGDVIINNKAEKSGMRPVIFSHWFHRIRFKCKVCHTEIGFEMRAGANDIRMADIIDGKYCGKCHNNKIAWGPQNCHLCHSGLPGLETGVRGGDSTGGPGKW